MYAVYSPLLHTCTVNKMYKKKQIDSHTRIIGFNHFDVIIHFDWLYITHAAQVQCAACSNYKFHTSSSLTSRAQCNRKSNYIIKKNVEIKFVYPCLRIWSNLNKIVSLVSFYFLIHYVYVLYLYIVRI